MMQNQKSLDANKIRRTVTRRGALAFAGSLWAATAFGGLGAARAFTVDAGASRHPITEPCADLPDCGSG
jgi:hypothetical protein